MKTLLLTVEDIRCVVQSVGINELMREMIAALESAFRAYDAAIIDVPPRAGFSYAKPFTGLLEWMPVLTRGDRATIKVVGYHPHNPSQHEMPTIISSVGVYDVRTGHLSGILDGTFLTALRTGAASALASRYLALPSSHVVGIIGTGAQAVTQLHALATLFEIERVLVYDLDPSASRSFRHRTSFLNLAVEVVESDGIESMVAQADILCTVTSTAVGSEPVFRDSEMKPWLHVNAVGSDFPGKRELPHSLLERAFVCPDFPDQARVEGECQQLRPDQIGPALYEIIQHPECYRDQQRALTVFDSTGWALEDAVAAQLLLGHAQNLRLGQEIRLQHTPLDPLNPYDFSL